MNINHFIEIVSQLSITSTDRIKRLYMELENIRVSNIEGDLVECGVYRGGNILGMMEYCNSFGLNKKIWLYDTFSGMTSPTAMDKDHNNIWAQDQWDIILCKEGYSLSNMPLVYCLSRRKFGTIQNRLYAAARPNYRYRHQTYQCH